MLGSLLHFYYVHVYVIFYYQSLKGSVNQGSSYLHGASRGFCCMCALSHQAEYSRSPPDVHSMGANWRLPETGQHEHVEYCDHLLEQREGQLQWAKDFGARATGAAGGSGWRLLVASRGAGNGMGWEGQWAHDLLECLPLVLWWAEIDLQWNTIQY
jgi:hypothetical protein